MLQDVYSDHIVIIAIVRPCGPLHAWMVCLPLRDERIRITNPTLAAPISKMNTYDLGSMWAMTVLERRRALACRYALCGVRGIAARSSRA